MDISLLQLPCAYSLMISRRTPNILILIKWTSCSLFNIEKITLYVGSSSQLFNEQGRRGASDNEAGWNFLKLSIKAHQEKHALNIIKGE